MIRDFQKNEADYRSFVDLFYRTHFSLVKGEPSGYGRYINTNSIPSYNHYVNIIIEDYPYHFKSFTDEENNVIAGAEYTKVAGTATIMHFFVLPEYQLKGNGRKFFNELQNYLRASGVIQINVSSYSLGSIEFWKKMNFEKDYPYYRKFLK